MIKCRKKAAIPTEIWKSSIGYDVYLLFGNEHEIHENSLKLAVSCVSKKNRW